MDFIDLHGRKILITGASSGIGRATAVLVSQLGGMWSCAAATHSGWRKRRKGWNVRIGTPVSFLT